MEIIPLNDFYYLISIKYIDIMGAVIKEGISCFNIFSRCFQASANLLLPGNTKALSFEDEATIGILFVGFPLSLTVCKSLKSFRY